MEQPNHERPEQEIHAFPGNGVVPHGLTVRQYLHAGGGLPPHPFDHTLAVVTMVGSENAARAAGAALACACDDCDDTPENRDADFPIAKGSLATFMLRPAMRFPPHLAGMVPSQLVCLTREQVEDLVDTLQAALGLWPATAREVPGVDVQSVDTSGASYRLQGRPLRDVAGGGGEEATPE